jgi:hypothetical protein
LSFGQGGGLVVDGDNNDDVSMLQNATEVFIYFFALLVKEVGGL